ncbi:hypothetical protein BLOT_010530 [Blomia tropicalis]|nr:hypothetical protein BLOT_010530 [Blomia tropicalis]
MLIHSNIVVILASCALLQLTGVDLASVIEHTSNTNKTWKMANVNVDNPTSHHHQHHNRMIAMEIMITVNQNGDATQLQTIVTPLTNRTYQPMVAVAKNKIIRRQRETKQHFCGNTLKEVLKLVCDGKYYGPNGESFAIENIAVQIVSGKQVDISWKIPPTSIPLDGYKLYVKPISEHDFRPYHIDISPIDSLPISIRNLTSGGTYEVKLHTVYRGAQSTQFAGANFTTKPNTPGRFIVWFRNETTLLVLWQPPYPSGIFDQYKVSIYPQDALQSTLYVRKDTDPPGPEQTSFDGLVPGRAYNITIQTVSRDQISEPTEAQYRTLPLSPSNVSFNRGSLSTTSFDVVWEPPAIFSEFDRYQVQIGIKNSLPRTVFKDESRLVHFDENDEIEPGETYEVTLKTLSGNVISSPVSINITTRPMPVLELKAEPGKFGGDIYLHWTVSNRSKQDSFIITYNELDAFNSDASIQIVKDSHVHLSNLFAGRNYSISVAAISNTIYSDSVVIYQPTKPASPVIGVLEPISGRTLNISWKWDVTSKQDSYKIEWIRNDTKERNDRIVTHNWVIVEDLYPGAIYEIAVSAISHGLVSDPHSYFQTIFPRPPEGLHVSKHTNSSMLLVWSAPSDSLVDHYIARYRPTRQTLWRELGIVNSTSLEIKNLVAGEIYTVRVSSVSNRAESPDIREIEQTMFPNPISNIKTNIDSHNITFHWHPPEGVIDYFNVIYNPVNQPKQQESLRVPYSNTTRPEEQIVVFINDLKPGEEYSFRFFVTSFKLRSEGIGVQIRTIPVIDSVINVIVGEHETKTMGIKYTPTPIRNVVFDKYRFQLSGTSIPVQEKLWNDTNRFVVFDNLVPGHLYNLSIWTVSGSTYSVPIQRQARLYPEPVKNINGLSITDSEITLSWDAPYGDKDGYEVQYFDPHEKTLVVNVTLVEKIEYRALRPHNNYTFIVTTLSGYGTSTMLRGTPISQTFLTLESVPGKDVKPNEITLQWSLPQSEQNGILTGYKIVYYIKGNQVIKHQLFESYETQGTIYNLIPGKSYVFQIQAHTKAGAGHKAQWEETMPIWSAPPPADNIFPTEVGHTSSSIRIRFRKNYFSNMYGPIVSYAVIVAEDDTVNSNVLDLASWYDVQDYSIWPPYQATEPFYPFNNSLIEDFVIGTDNCAEQSSEKVTTTNGNNNNNNNQRIGQQLGPKFCNGPLRAGRTYKIKIRAFTTTEKYTDTVYSYAMSTDPDHTAIYLSIFAPFTFIILILVIFFYLRHNRLGPFGKIGKLNGIANGKGSHSTNVHGHDGDTLSIMGAAELITSRPIKLSNFADHFRLMSADSDFRFSEEFELLKMKGREKCDHYWPYDTQPVFYGNIQVTILNESQYQDWTISEFKVMRGDQYRIVRHFHFTTWPDFGVPEPPSTLVKFVRAFRERCTPDSSKPIIVHCSAGVGRSGTFIALDRLLQHIHKYETVDIFGIVHEMRRERVWMVQNEQQYICIHECLLSVIEGREDILDLTRLEMHENPGYEDFLLLLLLYQSLER